MFVISLSKTTSGYELVVLDRLRSYEFFLLKLPQSAGFSLPQRRELIRGPIVDSPAGN